MSLKPWHLIISLILIFFLGIGVSTYFFIQQTTPEQILNIPVVKDTLLKKAGPEKKELVDLLPYFLGFTEPRTYLILFENNTEMRPGGGFIGTYATIRIENGKMETLAVEGSEVLDKKTPATWKPAPPKILQEKLGVDRWYFRDSNWSPDFIQSSKKALEFYKAEGGVAANDIDAVVSISPSVLEELLKITGPITIQGVQFTSANVVRTLEHEVEFGYRDKGINVLERKKIIDPFFHALLKKIAPDALLHTQKYVDLFDRLAQEKQMVVYFMDEKIQQVMSNKHWTGEVPSASGDFIMWVDANLGALKTDAAIQRELTYTFAPQGAEFIASAKMKYVHTGVFDKFTSRYRTYARVYVPDGAVVKEVTLFEKNGKKTVLTPTIDQGKELGKQWFGVFVSVEPKETKELEFSYSLPQTITDQIKAGIYTVRAQKQAGLEGAALTLNLNFGTNIQSASPAEEQKNWGNASYTFSSEFKTDKEFSVSLK